MKKLKDKWVTKNPENRLYHIPVPIVGLTGGIGTGKSKVAELFRKKDIPVIDADKLVKSIYLLPETKNFVMTHFPQTIINNEIVFKKLREIVFINHDAKKTLEDYIYSYLPEEFKKEFSSFVNPSFIVYDVPLLFEKKLNLLTDLNICIYAPKELQLQRIMTRDHIDMELANNILNSQLNIEDKKKLADLIITNFGSISDLENEFENFLKVILK